MNLFTIIVIVFAIIKNFEEEKILFDTHVLHHALCITPYTKISSNTLRLSIILNFELFNLFKKR